MKTVSEGKLVGTVKGPGETPHQYIFITSDNIDTRIGEFVYYHAPIGSDKKAIFGSITERQLGRRLPDGFFSNPNISPQAVSKLIGCELTRPELYEVTVTIKGYYEEEMREFVNPRISPDPGQQIYLVSDRALTHALSPRKFEETGSAHIGHLLTRDPDSVPVVLDVKDVVSTHLSILAGTGSGKSYTAGVLIEELMRPYNRAAVLVIDPHSEYSSLKQIESEPKFQEVGNYSPYVKIFQPDRVYIRISSLELGEIRALLPNMTEKMNYFLREAFNEAQNQSEMSDGSWSYRDLTLELERMRVERGEKNPTDVITVDALRWRLDSKFNNSTLFRDREHIPLKDLVRPGQCTVLQMSDIDVEDQRVIVATVLRRIYKARIDTQKGQVSDPDHERYLNYPVFVILEEGHRFAPQGAIVTTTDLLKTVLSEGRKFGVGVAIISQRPGKLDQDVLSQCMTQIIMRIVNPIDQTSIASGVESAGRDILNELPALTKGQAVIAGSAINTPVLCQIRRRMTPHGGETLNAPEEWIKYFSDSRQQKRCQDNSIYMPVSEKEFEDGFEV